MSRRYAGDPIHPTHRRKAAEQRRKTPADAEARRSALRVWREATRAAKKATQ